jgi:hypothetical protein
MAVCSTLANLLITRQNFSFTPGGEPIDLTSGLLWVLSQYKDGGSIERNCIVANRVIGNFLTVLFNLVIKLDCQVRM